MPAVTRLGLYGGPRAPYAEFVAAGAVITVSGTVIGATESDIRDGGKTIVLTVANDTWVASGATFNAQRQNIIDGLDAALSPALGWNDEVRDKEVVTAVARTSDTVVTITLSAAAAYDISADETITVTVPATALTGGVETVGTPTFDVTFIAVVAKTGGGRGSRRRKYPRRVVIDGKVYWVNSAAEERKLLGEYQARLEAEALMAAVSNAPEAEVKAARVKVKRIARRIAETDDREDEWLQRLLEEDEIILAVLH